MARPSLARQTALRPCEPAGRYESRLTQWMQSMCVTHGETKYAPLSLCEGAPRSRRDRAGGSREAGGGEGAAEEAGKGGRSRQIAADRGRSRLAAREADLLAQIHAEGAAAVVNVPRMREERW